MSSRFGVHAGLWGFDWTPASADRVIGEAAALGFDLIEIPAIDRSVLDAEDTRRAVERHGIEPVVSLALGPDDDISDGDPARSDAGEHRLAEAVTFADEIGARFVGGVVYSAMTRYHRPPTAAGRDNSLAVLRRIAARAAKRGITLGVEYVNRYESNLLNTAAQTVRFLDDLGADNVVLHLDTFHATIEEPTLAAGVRDAGARLGYIHASESHRGELGTGAVDWAALAAQLRAIEYHGPITVETFSSAVLPTVDAVDIGLWRALWADPTATAAASLAVLRDAFAAPAAL